MDYFEFGRIFERETVGVNFDDINQIASKFREPFLLADPINYKEVLIPLIDLTTLSGDDTRDRVEKLADRALTPVSSKISLKCAAVCVYPARVADVVKHLLVGGIRVGWHLHVASVAGGFPSGQYLLETRLLEIRLAVRDGANEIDTVINRAAALIGDWGLVFDEVRQMRLAAGAAHLKVILATGELGSYENIYKASWASMLAGADFIKTSTGKEAVNATLESAAVMCKAIHNYHAATGKRVGFKVAGGVRTKEDAFRYYFLVRELLGEEWLKPELFRIGASGLLDDILAADATLKNSS